MAGENNLQQFGNDIEALVQRIEAIADPTLRADVLTLVRSIMDLHAAGLQRVIEVFTQAGESGQQIFKMIAADELAGSLLLLHGLHPADTEERVATAIQNLNARLHSHGSSVTLLDVRDGTVRVTVEEAAHTSGCGSHAQALPHVVEEAIYSAAPEVVAVQIENTAAGREPLVQLQVNRAAAISD